MLFYFKVKKYYTEQKHQSKKLPTKCLTKKDE